MYECQIIYVNSNSIHLIKPVKPFNPNLLILYFRVRLYNLYVTHVKNCQLLCLVSSLGRIEV